MLRTGAGPGRPLGTTGADDPPRCGLVVPGYSGFPGRRRRRVAAPPSRARPSAVVARRAPPGPRRVGRGDLELDPLRLRRLVGRGRRRCRRRRRWRRPDREADDVADLPGVFLCAVGTRHEAVVADRRPVGHAGRDHEAPGEVAVVGRRPLAAAQLRHVPVVDVDAVERLVEVWRHPVVHVPGDVDEDLVAGADGRPLRRRGLLVQQGSRARQVAVLTPVDRPRRSGRRHRRGGRGRRRPAGRRLPATRWRAAPTATRRLTRLRRRARVRRLVGFGRLVGAARLVGIGRRIGVARLTRWRRLLAARPRALPRWMVVAAHIVASGVPAVPPPGRGRRRD